MNRAAAAERKARQGWDSGIVQFEDEAAGMLSVEIVRRGAGRIDAAIPIARWAVQATKRPNGTRCLRISESDFRLYEDFGVLF
jgi:hypothetical protein